MTAFTASAAEMRGFRVSLGVSSSSQSHLSVRHNFGSTYASSFIDCQEPFRLDLSWTKPIQHPLCTLAVAEEEAKVLA